MQIFKDGFRILASVLEIRYHTARDSESSKKKVFTYYNSSNGEPLLDSFTLNEEQSSILTKCLENCNDEDSIDRIKAEFKELGYECNDDDDCLYFERDDGYGYDVTSDTIFIEKSGHVEINDEFYNLTILRLINRILRLYGVEV